MRVCNVLRTIVLHSRSLATSLASLLLTHALTHALSHQRASNMHACQCLHSFSLLCCLFFFLDLISHFQLGLVVLHVDKISYRVRGVLEGSRLPRGNVVRPTDTTNRCGVVQWSAWTTAGPRLGNKKNTVHAKVPSSKNGYGSHNCVDDDGGDDDRRRQRSTKQQEWLLQ